MKYFIVLTTVSNAEQAQRLARGLVEARLAACVNIQSDVRSVYRWEGQIQDDPELLLLIKTREDRLDALEARINSEHPYDVPEFLVVGVDRGSPEYLAWVDECVVGD